ncbi:MAG: DUF481 domain-containing protein [Deltaproteobacteria bacterium]|jgi:hypothetical protein|nr:DUF481 domain-containing protein [Deltaproteobacteria bacterium]
MEIPRRAYRHLALLFPLLLIGTPALGDEEWLPPEPTAGGWDWARLDTGEWLKGEMIVMQNDVMIFDSDNFDELRIDWEDVYDLRLAIPRVFRRVGRRVYRGMGEIRDRTVRILTTEGELVEFPQHEIVSIVYTRESELRNWRVRVGVSLAAREGNTEQRDLSSNAEIRRDSSFTRSQTKYTGTFSEVDGDKTINNHRASTLFDWLLTRRFFIRVPSFEFFSDEFQNIDARYTPGASVGYELIETSIVEHLLTIGAAAQITDFDDGDQDEDFATIFTSELSLDFPRDIDLDFDYKLQLVATDLGKTSHHTAGILSFELWDPLDLDVGAYWDRIEQPEKDNDGERPKRDDFRLTVGLSLDF